MMSLLKLDQHDSLYYIFESNPSENLGKLQCLYHIVVMELCFLKNKKIPHIKPQFEFCFVKQQTTLSQKLQRRNREEDHGQLTVQGKSWQAECNYLNWNSIRVSICPRKRNQIRCLGERIQFWPTLPKIIFPSAIRSLYSDIKENHRHLGLKGTNPKRLVSSVPHSTNERLSDFSTQQSQLAEQPGLPEKSLITQTSVYSITLLAYLYRPLGYPLV